MSNTKTKIWDSESIDSSREYHTANRLKNVRIALRTRIVSCSVFFIVSSSLLIQLVDELLPACEHLQTPALIVVIARLGHKEVGHCCSGKHKSAHDLQDMANILALPVILLALVIVLEGISQEDLDNPRTELPSCRCNAVTRAPVTCREDLRWYLRNVSADERHEIERDSR